MLNYIEHHHPGLILQKELQVNQRKEPRLGLSTRGKQCSTLFYQALSHISCRTVVRFAAHAVNVVEVQARVHSCKKQPGERAMFRANAPPSICFVKLNTVGHGTTVEDEELSFRSYTRTRFTPVQVFCFRKIYRGMHASVALQGSALLGRRR